MKNSVSELIRERMKNMFLVNFIISWVIVNHQIVLYLIFSSDLPNLKLEKISDYNVNFSSDALQPLLILCLYVYILPIVNLGMLSIKLKYIEPRLSDYKNREQTLVYIKKLEIEDKRLDLSFREKERDLELENKKVEAQKKITQLANEETIAAAKRLEYETKEADIARRKREDLDKLIKANSLIDKENELNERQSALLAKEHELNFQRKDILYGKSRATWVETQLEAQPQSRVSLDFEGEINGIPFEGGKAENFSLAMGQDRMIPGFEDGIVGHKAGESFTIDVIFPNNYHAENLRGKNAQFKIILNKVEEQMIPLSLAS